MNRHDMSQSSQTLDSTLSKEISIISVTQMTKLIDYIFNILLIIDTSGRYFIRPWPHGQQRTFHWSVERSIYELGHSGQKFDIC